MERFVPSEATRCFGHWATSGGHVPDFSAPESGLGYLYQARYALWLLLDGPEEREVVLETLDDIVMGQDGTPRDLLQTKHNSVPARLTDASPQLWKTLRIWSTYLKDGLIRVPPTTLTLITTAEASARGTSRSSLSGYRRASAGASGSPAPETGATVQFRLPLPG